ncbi:ATP-binding protein [Streptomyces varsoviensis]|uniref:ATP-binding protein n=1 Tax=Streptomyces varsoviensis TaxID=67373 RepID=UPI0033E089AE
MAEHPPQRFERQLVAQPRAFARVRRAVASQLRLWGRADLVPGAAMCVTELLSNVHKHTATAECVLTIDNLPGGIRAAVSDADAGMPTVKEPDYFAESGRGMFLLSETADTWGVDLNSTGKTVWFRLETGGR